VGAEVRDDYGSGDGMSTRIEREIVPPPDASELLMKLKASQAARKEKIAALHDDWTWEVCGLPDDLERSE
jgi:hypothetical protein